MSVSEQATGILGGSFDPVHLGHVAIAHSFLTSGYITELWILLTPESPHKKGHKFADFALRLEMLERAFEAEKKVTISTIEHQLDPPFYTVNTLRYLSKRYPERSFRLCIGEDSLADFDTWHNWKKILNYAPLLVASRASYQIENPAPEIVDQMQFVDHHPVEISSTEIRDRLKKGRSITDLVPPGIEQIINNYNLYRSRQHG
ncbi:MAG TPA: nicotinate (nicotinamide) nucleotide adenylyltransferase [Fodinibius sp.]|nr:nicotinate (nicotinamide) nucleotide adenylyltransferase [Fodinibius sp.]